ncbi:hypothetical protein EVAR_32195_1 [Eumeta japonica]|uniref:Uncharacterized protein n=1 Tax=Eumeta variegata TaxID=151549 RepID=A0A4C1VZF3_EUMVA|nr:hypothetical protein EVAR_32195_1 [Eumeta japonica]
MQVRVEGGGAAPAPGTAPAEMINHEATLSAPDRNELFCSRGRGRGASDGAACALNKHDIFKTFLAIRKALQEKLEQERRKGKIVFLKYDKLVVKENESTKEKRKREISSSPHSSDLQLKNQQTSMPIKVNRTNTFDLM